MRSQHAKYFLGGTPPGPSTRARFARHNSRQRITSNSSSTPCFTATPLQNSWHRPWKAKGVVSLPLDGACVVQVIQRIIRNLPKKLSNPPFKSPAYGLAYSCRQPAVGHHMTGCGYILIAQCTCPLPGFQAEMGEGEGDSYYPLSLP